VPVVLTSPDSWIVAVAGESRSDTLRLQLGYALRPEIHPDARVNGRTVTLEVSILANPLEEDLAFTWTADPGNPGSVAVVPGPEGSASATIPTDMPAGEYYFDVAGEAANGTVRGRLLVTAAEDALRPFDIRDDRAAWIDEAVIYQVTPYNIASNGKWADVTARIPELAAFGINTLYLQPHYATIPNAGQGYGITGYFETRPDLGSPADLRTLVETAKSHGMRVIFDFVPNHSSIEHPYAQDAIAHGERSHYFDFYQRQRDDVRYSRHYVERHEGEMTFIRYFWDDLPNLNYHNPEVRRKIIEAGRYWIEELGIDGYRIDAVWGLNARNPDFMQEWRLALKRLKPEVLLLGEDKASIDASYDGRFDVAYDWTDSEGWVSQWGWEIGPYSETAVRTIFKDASLGQRSGMLRNALTNQGRGFAGRVLHFMENNDLARFAAAHGVPRTRMVSSLLFTLPGIPLMYQGQEVGFTLHPYQTSQVFNRSRLISEQVGFNYRPELYEHYRRLLELRREYAALTRGIYEEVGAGTLQRSFMFAFRRSRGEEHLITVLNMRESEATTQLAIPAGNLALEEGRTYYLTDLLTGSYYAATPEAMGALEVTVPGYTAQILYLGTEPVQVSTEDRHVPIAGELVLEANYPNPFNPSTTIAFTLPESGRVRLEVFDLLGRRVAVLADDVRATGRHEVVFDAAGLASGTYLYRLEHGGGSQNRRMTLLK
jgi:cyclomaltodextrinase / maltogenic alpha-amylase / neopullulanase